MPRRGYRFVENDIIPSYMPRSGLSKYANWFAPSGAMLICRPNHNYKAVTPNGAFPYQTAREKLRILGRLQTTTL